MLPKFKLRTTLQGLLFLPIILIYSTIDINAQLADSPWPTNRQNSKRTGLSNFDVTDNPSLLWQYDLSTEGNATIGLDGTIYVYEHWYLYAINPDGTLKWEYLVNGFYAGQSSTPTIDEDGTIYFGVYNGDIPNCIAINPDGSLKWEYQAPSGVSTSPAIDELGNVYFAAEANGYLYCLDNEGNLNWYNSVWGRLHSSPSFGNDGTIYLVDETGPYYQISKLYALNQDGSDKWNVFIGGEGPGLYDFPPVIDEFDNIYVSTMYTTNHQVDSSRIYSISSIGNINWYKTFYGTLVCSAIAIDSNGRIYFTTGYSGALESTLYSLNSNGYINWDYSILNDFFILGPTIDGSDNIYLASYEGNKLFAIKQDGTLKWQFQLNVNDNPSLNSATIGSDGQLYFAWGYGHFLAIGESEQESIIVLSPNGGENWLVGSQQLIEWSSTNVQNVRIDYSTNSGINWINETMSTTSDGQYDWTIPNTPSNSCLVKISNVNDPNVFDVSNTTFAITSQSIEVEFSYTYNGTVYVISQEAVNYNGQIGNLSFENTSLDEYFRMPYAIPNSPSYPNSRTFKISVMVLNDGQTVSSFFVKAFEPEINHNANLLINSEILTSDSDPSDNIKSESFEIWYSDFEYNRDNYSFDNWGTSSNEVSQLIYEFMLRWGFNGFLLPPIELLDLLYSFLTIGGHCYGISTTSILYKDNPSWLPDNASNTYQLNKSSEVLNNIRYAFPYQTDAIYLGLINQINYWYSYSDISATFLSFIKNTLSENYLVNSAYSKHSTVTHTIIKDQNSLYRLYDYNNNPGVNEGPINRSNFYLNSQGNIIHSSSDRGMWFEYPDFTLSSGSRMLIDTLTQFVQNYALDSLQNNNLSYLIIFNSYLNNSDTMSVFEVSSDVQPLASYDYKHFKLMYFDKTSRPSITVNSRKECQLSVMGIINENVPPASTRQLFFQSIPFFSDSSIAYLQDIFNPDTVICKVDFENDGIVDLALQPSYIAQVIRNTSNIPPYLKSSIPIQNLYPDSPFVELNLKEYISDEYFESLMINPVFDSLKIDAQVIDSILIIFLKNQTSFFTNIDLHIIDDSMTVLIPVFVKSNIVTNLKSNKIAKYYKLNQNFPNPFNPVTYIEYEIPELSFVTLQVYDILGSKISVLVNEVKSNGFYKVEFGGSGLPSGIYFYRLQAGDFIQVRKMMLLK